MDNCSEGLLMAMNCRRNLEKRTEENRRQVKRIDVLPDDILLEIFYFYVNMEPWEEDKTYIEAWQSLVHVRRQWRILVFRSPRYLNLRLFCTLQTPIKDTLDVWPALPLIVAGNTMALSPDTGNIIAALGQSNRVREVHLELVGSQLENVLAAMQVPFPDLTNLRLHSYGETLSALPDSFLRGSAPSLRYFSLSGIILFQGLPNLLLSSTHLVDLWLTYIPHSCYISPEAIVALISVLSSLRILSLGFKSPQSRPGWESRNMPPPKRSILPALKKLYFKGVTEYLEDLVTGIDTPRLIFLDITFFNQIDFDCPILAQFINRTPTLRARDKARVQFDNGTACIKLRYQRSELDVNDLRIYVPCREPDWQVSAMEQVCNSSLPPLSTVEDLCIERRYWNLNWKNDGVENTLWLQLLLPFTGVKNLYLSKEFVPGIVAALKEVVGGRITEVLPSLQSIFVEGLAPSGPFQENIERFIAMRQLSDHPIAISNWVFQEDLRVY